MYYYDGSINDYLAKAESGKVTLVELEEWLRSKESLLRDYLGEEDYNSLIRTDFTSEDAAYHVKEHIQRILNTPTYDHVRIRDLLIELIDNKESYVRCCREIYEEYCNGFDFFKEIALTSICYDFNHRLEQPDHIEGLMNVREFIIHEATKILELMDSGVIKIVQSNYYLDKTHRNKERKD